MTKSVDITGVFCACATTLFTLQLDNIVQASTADVTTRYNSDTYRLKAKFHYAIAGSELVRSWFEPDSVMEFGFEPVCDQLRTSFEPASVMEFGFRSTQRKLMREFEPKFKQMFCDQVVFPVFVFGRHELTCVNF